MNKISILDTFAADAINAPAMITGGGKCKGKSKGKSNKSKKKSRGSKVVCVPSPCIPPPAPVLCPKV